MDLFNIFLKKLSFQEYSKSQLDIELKECDLGNLNLLIGDNAQGKTRTLSFIRFLRDIHKGARAALLQNGTINAKLIFGIENSQDEIEYVFNISLASDGITPSYDELISKGKIVYFSRKNSILFDEASNSEIKNFFLPTNIPCVSSISGPQFKTILSLKSFFERIVLLESNRLDSSNIEVINDSLYLNDRGRNAASVLFNWQKQLPQLYNEVLFEFQQIFTFILKDSFAVKQQQLQNSNIQAPLMYFKEKSNNKEIVQLNWSDGMLRAICLIMLPITRFISGKTQFMRPSLVIVDEIENGLDFTSLSHLLNFYESWSSQFQIILSTHSPIVCNFFAPEKWRIVKRKGSSIHLFDPNQVEGDLDEERKKLFKDNWEFYRRHIAISKLYSVQ